MFKLTCLSSKISKVKTIILFTFLSAVILHLCSTVPNIYMSYKSYSLADRVYFLNEISDELYSAVNSYGFERGRVNVVLNDAGPVELMEDNRKFIQARRDEADRALTTALHKIGTLEIHDIGSHIVDIKKIGLKVEELRKQAGAEMQLPKSDRSDDLPRIWFKTMTDYIDHVHKLQLAISSDIKDSDVTISRYSAMKNQIMELRNIIAPEMSILSGVILSEKPITQDLKSKIEELKENTTYTFKTIELLNEEISSPSINTALQKLKQIYFNEYLPYRDATFPAAVTGGPYPYTQKEFLGHGVKALNQIAQFNNSVVDATSGYTSKLLNKQKENMFFQTASSLATFLLMVLIFSYLHYKVISPIAKLTRIINRLSAKDLRINVPFIAANNEIGELANSINVFKNMALQNEEDMRTIKQLADEQDIILSNADTGIIYIQDHYIRWANRAFNEMFKYDSDSLSQLSIEKIFPSVTACGNFDDECSPMLNSGNSFSKGLEMKKSDGSLFNAHLTCKAVNSQDPVSGSIWIISDETERYILQDELQKSLDVLTVQKKELEVALSRVKQLEGIIPICMYCKKIRDDEQSWHQLEKYISDHSEALFSHGVCPDCYATLMKDSESRRNVQERQIGV